jgi:hypothetical protein
MVEKTKDICAQTTKDIDLDDLENQYQKCVNLKTVIEERFDPNDIVLFDHELNKIEDNFKMITDRIREKRDTEAASIIDSMILVLDALIFKGALGALRLILRKAKIALEWARQKRIGYND